MGNDEMIVLLFQYGTAQVVKYSVRIFLLVDVVKTRKKEKRTRIKIKFKEFYFKFEKDGQLVEYSVCGNSQIGVNIVIKLF